jgi:hypothetical protein
MTGRQMFWVVLAGAVAVAMVLQVLVLLLVSTVGDSVPLR